MRVPIALTAALALTGCAQPTIAPETYAGLSCSQLAAEAADVAAEQVRVQALQAQARGRNAATTGALVGAGITGSYAVAYGAAGGDHSAELRQLSAQAAALADAQAVCSA